MFACEIGTPRYWELELVPLSHCFLKDIDALCVRQAHEIVFQDAFQAFDESLVDHVVEEFQFVFAVIECPFNAVLYKVFL